MHAFWRDHPWRLRAAVVVLAALAVAVLQLAVPSLFSTTENIAGDWTWRWGASEQAERRVVVVDIDEASLRAVGPWPWSRTTIARLSERLDAAGAAVQAYDIVFDSVRDGDAELARVWSGLPVVAGQVFSLDPSTTPREGQVGGALALGRCPPSTPEAHGYIANSAELVASHRAVGHLTPRIELDGVVRKIPALVCHEGRAYPSLALATLWRAAQPTGAAQVASDWQRRALADGDGGWMRPPAELASASLPGVSVPLDAQGDLRVPYRIARRAFASVPAHQVLDGTADAGLLRGAIVLVGATAFGLSDVTSTPLSSVAAGVEVHAQVIAALLDHRIPFTPRQAPWLQSLAGLLIAAVLLAVGAQQRSAAVKRLPVAGLGIALGLAAGAAGALLAGDVWLPWSAPALFSLLAAAALATAEHALTRAQRERLSAHLGSYLPGPVAQRLARTEPSGRIQVDQRTITVLVADIRNFSAFAAHRPPEETAALLHAFYCVAVDVVEQHHGVVENIVGDSVVAVWNAYSDCADHAAQALQAGKELLQATRALLARPARADDPPLVQPLALGVGIETGEAVVGSFGPERRRAHAALGEPVSVASRLQHMTEDLSIPLLVGPRLASNLSTAGLEPLGDYLLEGMTRQYAVFAPADWADLVPTDHLWAGAATSRPLGEDDEIPSGPPLVHAQPRRSNA